MIWLIIFPFFQADRIKALKEGQSLFFKGEDMPMGLKAKDAQVIQYSFKILISPLIFVSFLG